MSLHQELRISAKCFNFAFPNPFFGTIKGLCAHAEGTAGREGRRNGAACRCSPGLSDDGRAVVLAIIPSFRH